jgi:predicted regulator of Ras-like GTPase activity (Roadblock/LC7/MglB family)
MTTFKGYSDFRDAAELLGRLLGVAAATPVAELASQGPEAPPPAPRAEAPPPAVEAPTQTAPNAVGRAAPQPASDATNDETPAAGLPAVPLHSSGAARPGVAAAPSTAPPTTSSPVAVPAAAAAEATATARAHLPAPHSSAGTQPDVAASSIAPTMTSSPAAAPAAVLSSRPEAPLREGPAQGVAGGLRAERLDPILLAMCERGGFSGAVLADSAGLPVAVYPGALAADRLAAASAVLAEALVAVSQELGEIPGGHLTIDIDHRDKLVLHRFPFGQRQYFLLTVTRQVANERGEMERAVRQILEEPQG